MKLTAKENELVVKVLRDYHDNVEDKYVGNAESLEQWEQLVKEERKLVRGILEKFGLVWVRTGETARSG
jgi:hypothetical protein